MLHGLLKIAQRAIQGTQLKKGYLDSTMTVVEKEWNEKNNEKAANDIYKLLLQSYWDLLHN